MSRGSPVIFNILTVLVLLAACVVGACFAVVALNPSTIPGGLQEEPLPTILPSPLPTATSLIDTFPTPITPTRPAGQVEPTATFTSAAGDTATAGPSLTPSLTSTATQTATETDTPTATLTVTPSPTATPAGPTVTPSRTLSPFLFTLQPGTPNYQPNFANTAGCAWMGIAGQVFDLSGAPIIGLIVRVTFEDGSIDATTGTKTAYGPGGYEIYLNNQAVQTTGAYTIRLLNTAGSALSDAYVINTFADCNRNLIIINFVQNH